MSEERLNGHAHVRLRPRWAGTAFLVEAMLLLVFVVASVAIITQLFAASIEQTSQSERLTHAVALTTSKAERFAASPGTAAGDESADGLRISCDVRSERVTGGTMHHATITASDEATGSVVYTLETSRYESGVS